MTQRRQWMPAKLAIFWLVCSTFFIRVATAAAFVVTRSSKSSQRLSLLSSESHHLNARPWRYPNEDDGGAREKERERPTQTRTEAPMPDLLPSKPKIVVLGATGKIGRLVVQQLLENSSLGDSTIVALVRDYDKACRVLYDDLLVTASRRKRGKPVLQIVQADLVPPEELPGFRDDDEEDEEWLERASSAAKFYGNSVSEYDDGKTNATDLSANEALQEAIKDCTTIISCVGTVRPTNLWSDFLARPLWRILRRDVRDWCRDPRHPYYVNYASTRKALRYAEKEQAHREAALSLLSEDENSDNKSKEVPRIRFIRISDLCVAQQPWHFVPLLTNIIHSMVFKYQEMTERLLESSSLIDTIVLRPGDLCDEERNVTATSLQVSPTGSVPLPSRVGREDVASLAVAAALWNTPKPTESHTDTTEHVPPFHYTLGVRWVGTGMDPYPVQGRKSEGFPDANLSLQSALKTLQKQEKRARHRQMRRATRNKNGLSQLFPVRRRKGLKPHAICAALPVYMVLYWLFRTTCQVLCPKSPEWMVPFVIRFKETFALTTAFVVGPFTVLLRNSLKKLSGSAASAAHTYISF